MKAEVDNLIHRARKLRVDDVGTGAVDHGKARAGKKDGVEGVRVGGAVEALDLKAQGLALFRQAPHEGGLPGARSPLENDEAPGVAAGHDLVEKRDESPRGVAPGEQPAATA